MQSYPSSSEMIELTELRPHPENAKTHTEQQVLQIANSIKRFGWTQPIVVDEQNTILIGHGRARAARKLEEETVPVVRKSGLTEDQKRALLAVDNTTNLETGFDPQKMEAIYAKLAEVDFDMEAFGLAVQAEMGTPEGNDREQDENPTAKAKETYDQGNVKQLVLYFLPHEARIVNERIEQLMEKTKAPTKGDLTLEMVNDYMRTKEIPYASEG